MFFALQASFISKHSLFKIGIIASEIDTNISICFTSILKTLRGIHILAIVFANPPNASGFAIYKSYVAY